VTAPSPSTAGNFFIIKDSGGAAETNNISLLRNGSEKFDGIAATRLLSTNWGYWMWMSDGTNWYQVG